MSNMEKTIKLFAMILGISNIIGGLLFMLIIFMMQGFYLLLFGIFFIVFGISIIRNKIYSKLLILGIIPITLLFSFNIVMMGISKAVPSYYRTPLWVGLIIILPFWLLILFDFYFLKKTVKSDKNSGRENKE